MNWFFQEYMGVNYLSTPCKGWQYRIKIKILIRDGKLHGTLIVGVSIFVVFKVSQLKARSLNGLALYYRSGRGRAGI